MRPSYRSPHVLLAASALAAALLLTTAPAHAKDELTPLTVDARFNAADAAAQGFTIPDTAALKGIKRVAVPVFAVEFIVADNVTATHLGFCQCGAGLVLAVLQTAGRGRSRLSGDHRRRCTCAFWTNCVPAAWRYWTPRN